MPRPRAIVKSAAVSPVALQAAMRRLNRVVGAAEDDLRILNASRTADLHRQRSSFFHGRAVSPS